MYFKFEIFKCCSHLEISNTFSVRGSHIAILCLEHENILWRSGDNTLNLISGATFPQMSVLSCIDAKVDKRQNGTSHLYKIIFSIFPQSVQFICAMNRFSETELF